MDRRKQAHGTTSVWAEKEPTKSQELDRPLHEKQKEILDKTNRNTPVFFTKESPDAYAAPYVKEDRPVYVYLFLHCKYNIAHVALVLLTRTCRILWPPVHHRGILASHTVHEYCFESSQHRTPDASAPGALLLPHLL